MTTNKIYLREEQADDYGIDFNIYLDEDEKGNIIITEGYKYRTDFREGDVVTRNNIDFGYIYKINDEDDEVKVCWGYNFNDWERKIDLLIIPPEYGMDVLYKTSRRHRCDNVVYDWLKTINGFSDNMRDCLFEDSKFPEVDFIKYKENKLYDEKIDRNISLYREIGKYKLYKASVFNGYEINSWDKVFYILDTETKKVYFGGIKDDVKITLAILYKNQEQ